MYSNALLPSGTVRLGRLFRVCSNNRWGVFPALAGIRISELIDVSAISDLKG